MKIVIDITTGNAAFDDFPGERARLINKAIATVISTDYRPDEFSLMDSNGNTVGRCKVTGK